MLNEKAKREQRKKRKKVKREKELLKKAEEEKSCKETCRKNRQKEKETGDYALSVTGTDVKSMTQSLVAGSVSISVPDRSSFDIKA